MKFATSNPAGLLAATLALLVAVTQANEDAAAPRMQRLTRRTALEPANAKAPLARRSTVNATTDEVHHHHVVRQDKVASTVSNSTSSSSSKSKTDTVGELVNKHMGGSPYNVSHVLQLLPASKGKTEDEDKTTPALVGVKSDSANSTTVGASVRLAAPVGILNPNSKLKQVLKADIVRRGDDDSDDNEEGDGDDEECEEGDNDDDDDDEECEEDDGDSDEDDEECQEDGDEDEEEDEECEEDGSDDDDEDCDEEDGDDASEPTRQALDAAKNFASNNGGAATPSNVAEGSLTAEKGCTKFAAAESGDSCYKLIGTKDDATLQAFYKNNPSVDAECQNLVIGATYCVAGAA